MLIGLYVDYMILTYHRFDGELRAGKVPPSGAGDHLLRNGEGAPQQFRDQLRRLLLRGRDQFPGAPRTGGRGRVRDPVLPPVHVSGDGIPPLLAREGFPGADRGGEIPAASRRGGRNGWSKGEAEPSWRFFRSSSSWSILGSARTRFDAGIEAIGPVDSKVEQVQRVIEEKFGRKGEPLFLVARADGDRRLAEDFDALDLQGERWRRAGRVETFSSPAMLVPASPFPERVAETPVRCRAAGAVRRCGPRKGDPAGDGGAGDGSGGGSCGVCRGDRPTPSPGKGSSTWPGSPAPETPGRRISSTGPAMRSPPTWRRPADGGIKGRSPRMKEDVRALGPDFALTGPPLIFEEIRSSIVSRKHPCHPHRLRGELDHRGAALPASARSWRS